ncbi:hypothetical protein R3P38DRAFT_2822930 [Favolaschia claudopus]|uniref:Uncharacterized protein n=1 Tax=Favolaschia claudopus TaxID=2862362 RepID=A0AAW0EHN5_9AGAR
MASLYCFQCIVYAASSLHRGVRTDCMKLTLAQSTCKYSKPLVSHLVSTSTRLGLHVQHRHALTTLLCDASVFASAFNFSFLLGSNSLSNSLRVLKPNSSLPSTDQLTGMNQVARRFVHYIPYLVYSKHTFIYLCRSCAARNNRLGPGFQDCPIDAPFDWRINLLLRLLRRFHRSMPSDPLVAILDLRRKPARNSFRQLSADSCLVCFRSRPRINSYSAVQQSCGIPHTAH